MAKAAPRGFQPVASAMLRVFLLLVASLPICLLAVWSYAAAFWTTATPDMKGWMVVLFPMLALPPFVPWLVVAVPAAVALSLRNIAVRCLLIASAAMSQTAIEHRFFARTEGSAGQLVSAIGTMPFYLFVGAIWATTTIMFLIVRKRAAAV